MLQERLARVYVSDTMPVMCKFNNKMETVPVFFFFLCYERVEGDTGQLV